MHWWKLHDKHGMSDVIYLAYLVSPIGSIVSPFFLGMVADRFFAVQKVMGVMHILSGILCSAPHGWEVPRLFCSWHSFSSHAVLYAYGGTRFGNGFHLVKNKENDFRSSVCSAHSDGSVQESCKLCVERRLQRVADVCGQGVAHRDGAL